MTRQRKHEISVDGEPGWIRRASPLEPVVWRRGLPVSGKGNTGVAAGYTARWAVSDRRLMLVAILDPDGEVWPEAVTHLFGDPHLPIPATWFSGRIVVWLGEPIGSSDLGPIASTVEVTLVAQRGVVISSRRSEPGPRTLFVRRLSHLSLLVLLFGAPLVAVLLTRC